MIEHDVLPDVRLVRQRKLDELFTDQPFLSTTMRAAHLHGLVPAAAVVMPSLSDPDDPDDLLRRIILARNTRPIDSLDDMPYHYREPKHAEGHMHVAVPAPAAPAPPEQTHARTEQTGPPAPPAQLPAPTFAQTPEVLTLAEAAAFLRFGAKTLRTWARHGSIPCAHVGRRLRFRRTALLAWLRDLEQHKPA